MSRVLIHVDTNAAPHGLHAPSISASSGAVTAALLSCTLDALSQVLLLLL
jgi:hypothetical protein